MRSWILLSLFGLAAVVACWALFANVQQRTDKELLMELYELKKDAPNNPEAARKAWKKRGYTATNIMKAFESDHPNSPLLNEARLETLKILRHDPEASDAAVEVAKKLQAEAGKGSDLAAQGDLYLALHEFQTLFRGAGNEEELKEAWNRNVETIRKRLEGLLTTYPKNRHIADATQEVLPVTELVDDPKTRSLILDLVSKNQPDHPLAAIAHREKSLGQEFVFEFTPVGSEKKMSTRDLRGKVVVLDFWATWCPPCKAEIPGLKELYEKYQGKLEIIGVSRDQELAALTAYVKAQDIRWPQVFGPAADRLANQWGIEAIPAVFLLDTQGRLHSLNARGKLEKLVPALLNTNPKR